MGNTRKHFDEHEVIEKLKRYLPAQFPLKDFFYYNTLQAFEHQEFYEALQTASSAFGYRVLLPLDKYRNLYKDGTIKPAVLTNILKKQADGLTEDEWKFRLLEKTYDETTPAKIGWLRYHWKSQYKINLDKSVHSALFRILGGFLDQGVAAWKFPVHHKGLLASFRELEKNSLIEVIESKRVRELLRNPHTSMRQLLGILVGEESLYEKYLFDQQFMHPGWSGMVSILEQRPEFLLDKRNANLHDLILLELLLEINVLDIKFGDNWAPLGSLLKEKTIPELFDSSAPSELFEVLRTWHNAYEWSLHSEVLNALQKQATESDSQQNKTFQAVVCMDDRVCSFRQYLEQIDPHCETFATAGFFNVAFYYQPVGAKNLLKLCPVSMKPTHLVKEINPSYQKARRDHHFNHESHSLVSGWILSQTLGFISAAKLFKSIFSPAISSATSDSFKHVHEDSELTFEYQEGISDKSGLQVGFTIAEMAERMETLLKSIHLVDDFAKLVYIVGHGATSTNNTYYASYGCGACSGKPGSVNAKAACYMLNHPEVRKELRTKGIQIPDSTIFVAVMHDTTRDEALFYDKELGEQWISEHEQYKKTFEKTLQLNAKERSRRFSSIDSNLPIQKIHSLVKRRAVSMFETRPELGHATSAFCVIGKRERTKNIFFDRRSFFNSYDYLKDPDGKQLAYILSTVVPVGGGISLAYFFSKVDNEKLGSGSKLPHNVMGLIGVANGVDGDLRTGLPMQTIEIHDPIRLMVIIEQKPEVLLSALQALPNIYKLFQNEWGHLLCYEPSIHQFYLFEKNQFVPYTPTSLEVESIDNLEEFVTSSSHNLPIGFIKKRVEI